MNILVAAGGTGGDLFPAVAVIEQVRAKLGEKCSVVFVGNPNRIEARVVPELGYRFIPIPVTGFQGIFHRTTPLLPLRILRSLLAVRTICKRFKIDVILCGGTYISYPAGIIANYLSLPMMLLESNVLPGKTNRLLASRAQAIILAFGESKEHFPPSLHARMHVVGNPVRQSMLAVPPPVTDARATFGLDPHKPTLFVFGGSLGARSINHAVAASMEELSARGIQVLWQTGKNYTPPETLPDGIVSRVFIDDMASAYSAADLVVCRAGGGTVAELTIAGKPAVLVPLPSAANNEQEYNAKALTASGAAMMVRDGDLKHAFLPLVTDLLLAPQKISAMSAAAHALSKPNAARDAADILIDIATNQSSHSTRETR